MEDFELLRQFVERGSRDAFAELVSRHVGMVRAAALRLTRDTHLADDVTQAVFLALAVDARRVRRGERLSGWLLTAARYHASHVRQSESRRKHHEARAAAMTATAMDGVANERAWELIAPTLDEAIDTLTPRARDALLLRYIEDKSVRAVAAALRISEDAAKQRLSRAVEELRGFFTRRGVVVSAIALSVLLSANAVAAVPAEFAAATVAASLEGAAGAGAGAGVGAGGGMVAGKWGALAGVQAKVACAVLAVAVAGGAGVAARHALQAGGAPDAAAPGVAGATAATPAPAAPKQGNSSWRRRFDAVYALADGEVIKRVPPPYIPERDAYFNEFDPSGNMRSPGEGCIVTYSWDGQAGFNSWRLGAPTLQAVLGQCVGLPRYALELPLKERLRPVPGDWIIRPGSTPEQRMTQIGDILRAQTGWKVRFERREVEREVVVARGTFAYAPLPDQPDADDREAGMLNLVHLYVEGLSGERGASIGNVRALLTTTGELISTEIVDETAGPKATVTWRNHAGAMVAPASADALLRHVETQTGLRFTRERRMTGRWFLVPADK